jgi:NAD(P)-dependent dehydrogenase (short-subunit alcohol dehydrogenase family)
MQVNHLAPALLAMLLMPSLLRGSPSRIVNVNSIVSPLLSEVIL